MNFNYILQNRRIKEQNEKMSLLKGKLFEYVVFKWLSDEFSYKSLYCDKYVSKEQIDCYGELNGKIDLYECKFNLHEAEDIR